MRTKLIYPFLFVLILGVALPLFMFTVQHQQRVQQHAAGTNLLPGQKIWANGVSSYIFGTNNTELWANDNIETDTGVKQTLKNAHVPLIRTWFFDFSPYNTDTEIDKRLQTDANIGANCLGVLANPDDATYNAHVVTYVGQRCLMYEFGNEPDGNMTDYINQWNTQIPQLRKLNPNAWFIGPVASNVGTVQQFLTAVKASGILPDAVSWHEYPCWHQDATSCMATSQTTFTADINSIRQEVSATLGKSLPLGITEWNYDPSNPPPNYGDSFMTQFTTVALNEMIQGKLDFATQFTALNGAGSGGLDMFDYQNNGKPKAQWNAFASVIAQYYTTNSSTPTIAPTLATSPEPTPTFYPCNGAPTVTNTPNPSPTIVPTSTPTPYPSGVTFCGAQCQTNADCDSSGLTCGICDSTTGTCVSGISPTPLPSGIILTPTFGTSLTPTNTQISPPSGSPTLGPAAGTLAVHFEGIDPQNNSSPHHPQRRVDLSFYSSQDFTQQPVIVLPEIVTFSPTDPNGSFVNSNIDLSTVPLGIYYILVKSPEGSLQELANSASPVSIQLGQSVSLNGTSPLNLRMGDLNNANAVGITDYNILVDCYAGKVNSPACIAHAISDQYLANFADINDDGTVDGIDYNILIRNIGNQGYGNVPSNSTTLPQSTTLAHFSNSPCTSQTPTQIVTPTAPFPTPTGTSTTVHHYEYVFPEGSMDVYDIDNNFKLVESVSLPTAGHGIRGVAASPVTHNVYVSYGGDGTFNGNGSLLAYNLLTNQVSWTKNYNHGIDSMAITPDGSKIYMPDGETTSDGKWYVVDGTTGNETGAIIDTNVGTADNGPHNTAIGVNGQHVFMGDRNLAHSGQNYFYEGDTTTNQVINKVGPFQSGIRPFAVNKAETLAFVTVTGFLGFQVGDMTTGKVLYTVPLTKPSGVACNHYGVTDPSHGISLSPDESQLYVIDHTCNYVHVFDVSHLPSTAPVQITAIPVTPYNDNQSPCTYDCEGDGWLSHSIDGRYVFVGSSGDIIDTSTQKVVYHINTLNNTRIFLEIDSQNNVPISTQNRSAIGSF